VIRNDKLASSYRSEWVYKIPFKGTVARDFRPSVFFHQSVRPWFTGYSRFAYGLKFAEKIDNIRIQRGQWPRWNLKSSFCPLNLFKREYPAKLFHREITPYHILTLTKKSWGILDFIFGFSGVIRCEYLGKKEAICETALARESGL
jgi:hypothetical protein